MYNAVIPIQFLYFLSDSERGYCPGNDQIGQDAGRMSGGSDGRALYINDGRTLYINETGFPKKGKMSVGVARQWCRQLGKTDNCQVGVFATLGHDRFSTPIDCRLYLPREWTEDKRRCLKAKVSPEHIHLRSKHELALEMVLHARKKGIRLNWIGRDAFYGDNPEYLRGLADNGEIFMADVHRDQRIYLKDPRPIIPKPPSSKGRKPSKPKAQTKPIRVDRRAQSRPDESWRRIEVRDTTKGVLIVDILQEQVWLWDGNEPKAGGQPARHHHMTMVMSAMLFMLEQRFLHKEDTPLLSCYDIAAVLKSTLPRRDIGEDEILRQLEVRHKKRLTSTQSAYQKQRHLGLLQEVT